MAVSSIRSRLCRSCRILAGYTMGQADNIRRAMSKKKQYVIDAERQNFVYGNEEQGIKGCIANGISEKAANEIYDSMVDFAKYAFNKSHAAAYAVVAYQTAYLKYYYPVEFMAALMTSVIDNTRKVAEYIYTCRQMGIKVLPPDINDGRGTLFGDERRASATACMRSRVSDVRSLTMIVAGAEGKRQIYDPAEFFEACGRA